MYKFTRNDIVDTDAYEAHLRKNGAIYYDREATKLQLQYMQCTEGAEKSRATDVMFHRSRGNIIQISRESIFNYLTRYEQCPDHYFFSRKNSNNYSLDKKKVLMKLYANGYALEFLEHYMLHKSLQQKAGDIESIISKCREVVAKSNDGTDLCKIPYEVNMQKNERFNYRQFDIISQIPKEFCTNIYAPAGYFLAWGDFAQSDFRIAYNLLLRSEENDKVMGKYADKYEALARLVAKSNNENFDLEKFKNERVLYKTLTLATMYGTRDSLVKKERDFIYKLVKFLYTCPKYVEYEKRLKSRILLGLPIAVESYFGYNESIAIQPYNLTGTINDALNSPMQTGTSEIIILTVNHILDEFFKLGYTEEDVSVYYVRHDEPIFLVRENVLKDIWVLNQFSQILVDDWVPLKLDFEFGYAYKVIDGELEKKVSSVFINNLDKIEMLTCGSVIDHDYYPVADVFTILMHYTCTGTGCAVVSFLHEKTNSFYSVLVESESSDVIEEEIRAILARSEQKIHDAGYEGICVISNSMNGEDFFGKSYVRYVKEVGVRIDLVSKLCRYFVFSTCQNVGAPSPVECPIAADIDKIKTLTALELLE